MARVREGAAQTRGGTGADRTSVAAIAPGHAARVRSYELSTHEWNRRG
ncbi:hypothetical protein NE857_03125 [Nocardiopsis exhalans]|uniref:Uncharacterized protein n=1 Tax=Nocardiopsis exhalans TaxID=163604 RepID=A0ABY5D9J2_9ACTN|nr:hypothetical protein [Nocardiopsis exhalans]USY20662.1 hypothetical protein NE857_03125 [Nocardiopsis exhalans]